MVLASFSRSVLLPPLCFILICRFREPSLPQTFWQFLYGQIYWRLISLAVLLLCFLRLFLLFKASYLYDFYCLSNRLVSSSSICLSFQPWPILEGSTVFYLAKLSFISSLPSSSSPYSSSSSSSSPSLELCSLSSTGVPSSSSSQAAKPTVLVF